MQVHDSCSMPTISQAELSELVRETRQRLELSQAKFAVRLGVSVGIRPIRQVIENSQAKFAVRLGVSFQSVNRWKDRRTRPLPIALKQIEHLLHQMGDTEKDMLTQYFSE